jgi:hypothetical protein
MCKPQTRFEYKITFDADIKKIPVIINKINEILCNSELNEHITNIEPTITIIDN